jgi:WD40 repeat protein
MTRTVLALLLWGGLTARAVGNDPPAIDRYGDPLPAGAVARLGFVRTGSSSPLNIGDGPLAAFSPDGQLFATACYNRVHVWDVRTGRVRHRFQLGDVHTGRLAFSADGKSLLALEQGVGHVHALDPATGRIARRDVAGMSLWGKTWLSPHGRWLIDVTGAVWDLAAGKKVVGDQSLPTAAYSATVAFTADERRVLIADRTRAGRKAAYSLEEWDIAAGKRLRSFDGFGGVGIACSPDGRAVAAPLLVRDPAVPNKYKATVVLYDTEAGRERLRVLEDPINVERPVFSPDGKLFAAVAGRSTLHVWDATTGKAIRSWKYDRDHLGSLTFSPDGATLGLCGDGGTAILWDVQTGKPRFLSDEIHYAVTALLFSPDGKSLVSGNSDGTLRLWDIATGEARKSARYGESIAHSTISHLCWGEAPDTLIYHGFKQPPGEFRVLDWVTGRDASLGLGDGICIQAVSASGRALVVGPQPPLGFLDARTKAVAPEQVQAARQAAAARPELKGFRILTPAPVQPAPATNKLAFLGGPHQAAQAMSVAPDGTSIVEAVWERDGNAFTSMGPMWHTWGLRLVDAASGRVLRDLGRPHHVAAFAPNGWALVLWSTANRSRDLELVEAYSGQVRWKVTLPGPVGNVAVSPDGRVLAVTEYEGDSLHLLNAVTGRALCVPRPGRGYGGDPLAFSPDGTLLARSAPDGTVLLWTVPAAVSSQPEKLSADDLAGAWRDLVAVDGATAFRALSRLAATPADAVPLFRKELLREHDRGRIERLIAGLDADEYAQRERSTGELTALGPIARPFLIRALRPGIPLEARTRIEKVLEAQADPFGTPAGIRQLRTVEALERIGSTDSRRLLEHLVEASPDDPLAREAKRAIDRLRR